MTHVPKRDKALSRAKIREMNILWEEAKEENKDSDVKLFRNLWITCEIDEYNCYYKYDGQTHSFVIRHRSLHSPSYSEYVMIHVIQVYNLKR